MKKLIPDLTSTEITYAYTSTSVPTPYPTFESYVFLISPTHGLCKVGAIGMTITRDPYGTETHSSFEKLQGALTAKYGEPLVADKLIAETIWDGSGDWAMALYENARVLRAVWPEGDGPLGFGLGSISLEAMGQSNSSTYLMLTYEGENANACMEQMHDAL